MGLFSLSSKAFSDADISALAFHSTTLRLVAFSPSTLDPVRLEISLRKKIGNDKHVLSGEQIVLDFSSLPDIPTATEVMSLITLLKQYNLKLVAAENGNAVQMEAAREAGLILLSTEIRTPQVLSGRDAAKPILTRLVDRPVRTGQQIYAKQADLVVLALVSAGAEIIADGSIHVYAPLRGRALAGASGEQNARIYTTCLEAELVSIAGVYRVLDEELPTSIKSRPSQIYLNGDKLVIEALKETY